MGPKVKKKKKKKGTEFTNEVFKSPSTKSSKNSKFNWGCFISPYPDPYISEGLKI